jgi:ribonucleoside-diphosphate reductase alpha chain
MSQAILFDEVTAMSAATRPKLSNSFSRKSKCSLPRWTISTNDELAATTWMNKYALRNSKGELTELDPADTHRRMAREFARIERSYGPITPEKQALLSTYGKQRKALDEERIFELFDGFRDIVPQGSVMASLGDDTRLASLSNCVVIPAPVDSYGGIFRNDQQLAQLFKRRCGVGFDLSTLRPGRCRP